MRCPKGPPHLTLKPFQIKQKQKQNNKQNPTTKTKQTETKQKQNKTNKEGFRANRGGPLGHLTWPLNPPKKKTKRNQKKQHIPHNQTKETQNSKNRNQNIATWFVKQQQQGEKKTQKIKTNKRKGQHKKQRVLKASAKNLKNLQKNSVFSNITSELVKQNLIEDCKNTNVHN